MSLPLTSGCAAAASGPPPVDRVESSVREPTWMPLREPLMVLLRMTGALVPCDGAEMAISTGAGDGVAFDEGRRVVGPHHAAQADAATAGQDVVSDDGAVSHAAVDARAVPQVHSSR